MIIFRRYGKTGTGRTNSSFDVSDLRVNPYFPGAITVLLVKKEMKLFAEQ